MKAEVPFPDSCLNGSWGKDNGEIGNPRKQGPLGPGPSSLAELFEQQLMYLLSSQEFCYFGESLRGAQYPRLNEENPEADDARIFWGDFPPYTTTAAPAARIPSLV